VSPGKGMLLYRTDVILHDLNIFMLDRWPSYHRRRWGYQEIQCWY
jgi:hypothetical protein